MYYLVIVTPQEIRARLKSVQVKLLTNYHTQMAGQKFFN